jgi:CheY-like chemotaxis protein
MEAPGTPQPRLLLVELTQELREILTIALTEEGYLPASVSSFEAAHGLLDEQTFEFVLADLFVGSAQPGLAQANLLKRRAQPTPMGLLTTQRLPPEEAKPHGFAFLLQMPFDLEELLRLIAANIRRPLSAEQARQAERAERLFVALNGRDMETAMSLCAEDVAYYPPAASPVKAGKKVEGRAPYRAHLEELFRLMPDLRFEEMLFYGRPKGLAARYAARWSAPNGTRKQLAGTTLFRFRGEQIAQVGILLNSTRLRQLLEGVNRR